METTLFNVPKITKRRIGFTGTNLGMSDPQMATFRELLKRAHQIDSEFHHGGCIGADVEAADIANDLGYKIALHPPVNKTKTGRSRWHYLFPEEDYIKRDKSIVEHTDALIATPHTNYEIIRSGTWTTIRYAQKLKRPIWIINRNGLIVFEYTKS